MVRLRVRTQVLPNLDRYASALYLRAQRLRFLLFLIVVTVFIVTFWPKRDETGQILLIDPQCLPHVEKSEPCPGPVQVAFTGAAQDVYSGYINLDYEMQEVYDLTTSITFIPTKAFAEKDKKAVPHVLPRFVIKKSAEVAVSLNGVLKVLEIAVPVGLDQFLRFWKNGRKIECLGDLERPNGTAHDVINNAAFGYDKLRQRADIYGSNIFLIGKSLDSWYRKCRLDSPLQVGIFEEEFYDYLLYDISRQFAVSKVVGKRDASLQLNIDVDGASIVLNLLYKNSDEEVKFVVDDEKTHFLPRYHEFCSTSISGFLVTVPCDVSKGKRALFEAVF
ncbi:unnamed protein product [Bursaphelenchus xylophilus]|uniref:(pine wood nematode) hypothetical protein n=1 Tax=Bursaphelenchus xylophilus TaxID=6326 RepID=A0A1I7SUM8_BURXY|nr:unnamed protein product [Bursaphelenchus xylophilus]CAG9126005.1 unnamed protein product [Bursaphelenchus xylophilus]